jgi:hypothetical protein
MMIASREARALDVSHYSNAKSSAFRSVSIIVSLTMLIFHAGAAFANDYESAFKREPAIYLDLRTIYAHVPAGSLAFGFGRPMPLKALLTRSNGPAFPTSVPAAKSLNLDLPLTVDITDSVSLYTGVSGNSTEFGGAGWSSFQITSWNIGFQADVYQQNNGPLPTVTLQSTLTQSIHLFQ